MEKEERIKLFNTGLSLIINEDVRKFCEILLENADEYFFHEPASSTGKYHPQYALGEGGLARHSISVALILHDMLRTNCYEFSEKEMDLLICGALVHDIKKYGSGNRYTVKEHPELAAKYVIAMQEERGIISDEEAVFMADAIKTHMGQWGAEKPSTDAQKLVHMADCLASRKYLEVKFEDPNLIKSETSLPVVESAQQKNEISDPGEYVMTFGKYAGEKLKNIDITYVDFLANKFSYKEHPVVKIASKYLEQKRQERLQSLQN